MASHPLCKAYAPLLDQSLARVRDRSTVSRYVATRLLNRSLALHAEMVAAKKTSADPAVAASASNMELEFRLGRAAARGVRGAPERLFLPIELDTVLTDSSHKFISGAQKKTREDVIAKCRDLVAIAASASQNGTTAQQLETSKKDIVVSMPDDSRLEYAVTSDTLPSPLAAFGTKKRVDQLSIFRPRHLTDVRIGLSEEKDLRPEYSHIPKTPPAGLGQLSVVRIRERSTFALPDLCLKIDVSEVSFLLDKHKFSPCETMTLSELPATGRTVFDVEIEANLEQLAEKVAGAADADDAACVGPLFVDTVLALVDHLAPAISNGKH